MQDLIEKLHDSDAKAFEEIYRLFHQKIYNFILRYVQDKADAQELTQLFFVRLWVKRNRLSSIKPLESQVYIIARNLVIDEFRKKARANKLKAQLKLNVESSRNITEQAVLYSDLREHLENVIETLPEKRKVIFKLNRQKGLTYREIAEKLSISQKTVEAQMSRALQRIRTKLTSFLHIFF